MNGQFYSFVDILIFSWVANERVTEGGREKGGGERDGGGEKGGGERE